MSTPNPIATFTMQNGAKIVVELMPHLAPNTVRSFIHLANQGAFDHHPIERIERDFVVDASAYAFRRAACRYLIANEAALVPESQRLLPDLGTICMGGYENGIAGGEFFFPLTPQKRLDGGYPCFGKILGGVDEIVRLGQVAVEKATIPGGMDYRRPVEPQVIVGVIVDTFGIDYDAPDKLDTALPAHWLAG